MEPIYIASKPGAGRVPCVKEGGPPVAEVVRACHDQPVDRGLTELAVPGLDRDALDRVLVYCAEQRCQADNAACPGCRRTMEMAGIHSLDAFVARHETIAVASGGVHITGPGTDRLSVPSIDDLVKSWAGEEYWFWARRILRKLRHGIRRSAARGHALAGTGETPAILLMEPQLPDNIGMVARAMANFGLDELRLIAPRDGWPNEKALIAASGANYVIEDAEAYPSLADGIGDLHWLCATTARQRDLRKPVLTPEQAVAELRSRITAGQRCGILFGRERSGLETAEVSNADALVMIPVNSRFASLNLAQAVLVLGYEWMRGSAAASLGRVTTYETPLQPGLNMGADTPATRAQLLGFFDHLESELETLGFFTPVEKRSAVIRNLRSMFVRMSPTDQEVRTLRGLVATLVKGKGSGRKLST